MIHLLSQRCSNGSLGENNQDLVAFIYNFLMHRRLRSDLILLLTAAIWGQRFCRSTCSCPTYRVFLFNSLRFLVGAALLLPFADLKHN